MFIKADRNLVFEVRLAVQGPQEQRGTNEGKRPKMQNFGSQSRIRNSEAAEQIE